MKKRFYLLFVVFSLSLLSSLLGWAKVSHATDTSTDEDIETDTPTSTDTNTPTPTPTINVALGHKFYTFDALWTNSSDPINDPEAIAISPNSGHIVIADSGNNRIAVWDTDGTPLKSIGSFGTRADWRNPPQFNDPCGVYVDPAKKLYVADTQNNRIVELDETGMVVTSWGTQGSDPGQFSQPRSICVDHFGNFWVLDSGNSRVQIFSAGGQYNATFGSFGTADYLFNNPLGMALNNIDQAIIADTGNFRFEVCNAGGAGVTQAGAAPEGFGAGVTQEGWFGDGPYQFKEPGGVVVTKEGWVAIVDGQNNGINFYNSRNGQYEFIGMWRAKDDIISPNYSPHYRAIACDAQDRLYLTDIKNNQIIRLKPINKGEASQLPPTPTPTPAVVSPYGGNGYPIR
jgi:tripartite motif-containing protein 71